MPPRSQPFPRHIGVATSDRTEQSNLAVDEPELFNPTALEA